MANDRDFKVLSDIDHCLIRPGMYLGSVVLTESERWIYSKEENRFHYGKVMLVPALLKYVSELIDNSIDVAIDTDFKFSTKIEVNITDKSVEVIDNGIGIPCVPPKDSLFDTPESTCACLAWTKLKSGTSFGENRNKIGTNGVGASCCAVFSKLFIGESDDGKLRQTITCRNNLSSIEASKPKKSSGKSGCRVYCEPDLKRFGLEKIDQTHKDAIYQRLVNLSMSFPKIHFHYNGRMVKTNDKKIAEMFSDNIILESSDNATIGVFPNEYDEFKFYSTVNGIDTIRGGTHIDVVSNEICTRVRDKLVKKYKSIRPGDIKNKICLVVFFTGFLNPEFDSQTKESISNSVSSVNKHLSGKIDFDDMAKKILKNDAIINPIIETFKIKEELKAKSELKSVKKIKVKSDKYFPGIGQKKYLFLVEGLSACGGILKCLGRNGMYYYALRGLPLNAYDSSIQKIAANQEVKDVLNILNLDLSKKDQKQEIEFEKIVIATDADIDGINLASMLFGWWYRMCPNLYPEHKIYKLKTPIVILKDSKDKIGGWFYTFDEFKIWEKTNKDTKLKVIYLKGLGSLETSDLDHIIAKDGFDSLLEEYTLDDRSKEYFQNWLGPDPVPRKKYLKEYELDIDRI